MLNFNNLTIKSIKEVEILGIKIDNNLNFNNHTKSVCRKTGQKLGALLKISSNLSIKHKKLFSKSMMKCQFNYCSLVWMFCSRQSNNLINKIHERSLGISYKDQKISYHYLLETHNELTIIKEICNYYWRKFIKLLMVSSHQLWALTLSFKVTNIILEIFKYSQLTSEEQ